MSKNFDKEIKSIIKKSNGFVKRVDPDSDPQQYKNTSVGGNTYHQVPESNEGGGVKGDPYGEMADTIIRTWDEENRCFVPAGKMRVPDSVAFKNKSPYFLEQKAKEREFKRNKQKNNNNNMIDTDNLEKTAEDRKDTSDVAEHKNTPEAQLEKLLLERGVSSNVVGQVMESMLNSTGNTADSAEEDVEESMETPVKDIEESMETPVKDIPKHKTPSLFTEVAEEEFAHAASTNDTSPMPSGITNNMVNNASIKVTIENAAGTFITHYYSVTALTQTVICTYNKNQDTLFIPARSKSREDTFILRTDNNEYELLYGGEQMEIPDTELGLLVFYQKD